MQISLAGSNCSVCQSPPDAPPPTPLDSLLCFCDWIFICSVCRVMFSLFGVLQHNTVTVKSSVLDNDAPWWYLYSNTVVFQITELPVRITFHILSHGSDHFSIQQQISNQRGRRHVSLSIYYVSIFFN